jgi:methionine-S-sulfoxide reductase
MAEIYLAGGCFWGVEKYLSLIRGVLETKVGYANGKTADPSYQEVCTGETGHAETVHVSYDPAVLPLPLLLSLFFAAIDPTLLNRQGNDVGTQYRTGIYYTNPADKPVIDKALAELQARLDRPIVVEALPLQHFYSAEEYHQKYLDRVPNGYCHIGPDLFRFAMQANPEK